MPKTANSVNTAGVTCVKSVLHAGTGVRVGVRSHIMCTIWCYIPMTAHLGCAGRTCNKPCQCPWNVSLTYGAARANVLSAGEGGVYRTVR